MPNKIVKCCLLAACLLTANSVIAKNLWTLVQQPAQARTTNANATLYLADEAALKWQLESINITHGSGATILLPMADGTMRQFAIRPSALLPEALAAKYPGIKTYDGVATDDASITAKLDITPLGFHAQLYDGGHTTLIDPTNAVSNGYYRVMDKKDAAAGRFGCTTHHDLQYNNDAPDQKWAARTDNGNQLRTYKLALSANNQYCQTATGLASPTVEQALSKVVTTINRVNGVYERELAITMQFVANEDTLIWPTATGSKNGPDPFNAINDFAAPCVSVNQKMCDSLIGNDYYDIGHVFTTGAGGLSQLGIVCVRDMKAQSVTGFSDPVGDGFDIDYVAHEIGHEFGADHPFNNGKDKSCCCGNINAITAFEPGSGSTIMAYAGICKPDNIQPHSDDYFHTISLQQINTFVVNRATCAALTPTNTPRIVMPLFSAAYAIPYKTPFELTAPANSDTAAHPQVTYCWEQWNRGDAGARLADTYFSGPIFRSFPPKPTATRIFPEINMVIAGNLSNAGIDNAEGEKAPDTARFLTFKVTVRSMAGGAGTFVIPDDTIHLDVINTGEGFAVTSQIDTGISYVGGSLQNITWNNANSNAAPINAADVEIFLSQDGGYTWPHSLGKHANTGSALVRMPNPDSTWSAVRVKVKGANNVFFNINRNDFTLTHSDGKDTLIALYPVPAHNSLTISSGNRGEMQYQVYNAVGQLAATGLVNGTTEIPVAPWARGVYIMRLTDLRHITTVIKFVLR